jgi:hypothetical protein
MDFLGQALIQFQSGCESEKAKHKEKETHRLVHLPMRRLSLANKQSMVYSSFSKVPVHGGPNAGVRYFGKNCGIKRYPATQNCTTT